MMKTGYGFRGVTNPASAGSPARLARTVARQALNKDPTGYLPIALPESPPAGEEGVIRRWLDVAIEVERPRRDLVLARGRCPPV